MGIYDDMLFLERPESAHPRMKREDRAKQFMPFASLRGFGDEIREREFPRTEKRILDEDENAMKDAAEEALSEVIGERPDLKVLIFIPRSPGSTEGRYLWKRGRASGYDPLSHTVVLDGERICLSDAARIEFPGKEKTGEGPRDHMKIIT